MLPWTQALDHLQQTSHRQVHLLRIIQRRVQADAGRLLIQRQCIDGLVLQLVVQADEERRRRLVGPLDLVHHPIHPVALHVQRLDGSIDAVAEFEDDLVDDVLRVGALLQTAVN